MNTFVGTLAIVLNVLAFCMIVLNCIQAAIATYTWKRLVFVLLEVATLAFIWTNYDVFSKLLG